MHTHHVHMLRTWISCSVSQTSSYFVQCGSPLDYWIPKPQRVTSKGMRQIREQDFGLCYFSVREAPLLGNVPQILHRRSALTFIAPQGVKNSRRYRSSALVRSFSFSNGSPAQEYVGIELRRPAHWSGRSMRCRPQPHALVSSRAKSSASGLQPSRSEPERESLGGRPRAIRITDKKFICQKSKLQPINKQYIFVKQRFRYTIGFV